MFFVFIYKRLSVCPHPLLLPLPQGEGEGIRIQCSYLNAYPRSPSRREGAIRKSYFFGEKISNIFFYCGVYSQDI